MSEPEKTHREVKAPQMTARYLADFMAASERARRTIIRNCKYQPIARVVQHDHAKLAISGFIQAGSPDTASLLHRAQQLKGMMADSDFDRDVLDHNADYILRFASVFPNLSLPKAEILNPGQSPKLTLHGIRVKAELQFRLRRVTKTNKVKTGAAALRYAKGKPLNPDVAAWQSAFLFGILKSTGSDSSAEPEGKLSLTLDAHTGICHAAPTDAVSRFHNMEAACATIAERWPNIAPPENAIL